VNSKLKIAAMLLPVICFCGGCGTICTRGKTEPGDWWATPTGVYRGVRLDGSLIGDGDLAPIVDIPLSAIADTIVLPYDLSTLHTNKVNVPPNNSN
jgi:uncharacterized protein YceK